MSMIHELVCRILIPKIQEILKGVHKHLDKVSNLEYKQIENNLTHQPEKMIINLIDIYIPLKTGKITKEEAITQAEEVLHSKNISKLSKLDSNTIKMITKHIDKPLKTVVATILTKNHKIPKIDIDKHTLNGLLLLEYIHRHPDNNINISTDETLKLKLNKHDKQQAWRKRVTTKK